VYKACIFDLDGTLADTLEALAYCTNLVLKELGLEPNPVYMYKQFAGDGAKVMLQRSLFAAGDRKLELFDRAYEIHKKTYEKFGMYNVKPIDGITELLDELKGRGIKIAVLTNKPHKRAIEVITSLFGENYFDIVLGQSDDFERKPSPQGALYISKKFGISPEECVYLGDTNTDMKTGKAAGMFTVGVMWGFRERQELIDNNADFIIDTPLQLLPLLKTSGSAQTRSLS